MITRFATLTGRLLAAFAVLFTITACGGGGGGGGGDSFLPDDGSGGINYKIELSITDAAGNPTDTVTATTPVTLTALVTRKGNGQPVAEVVITAIADIGVILPETGSALTNASGIATLQIAAGDELGAGTVEITIDNPTEGGEPFTAKISFRVGQAGLRLGHFNGSEFVDGVIGLDATELAVGGSALLRLAVVDENGELATTAEMIKLKSGCALSGLATLPADAETVNGQATVTYTATGCGGEDEVTANLVSNGAGATATLTVAPPGADVIEFVSVVPETSVIALKGTGTASRPESATVSFRVISGESSEENPGTTLPGVPVEFTISTDVGGIKLQNSSGTTDANGVVKATVQSGNIASSVTITATIQTEDGEGPSTASPPIVVSTGLPDQNSISLSASTLNVQGALNFDGKTAVITVRMADKFNNPVADGTSAVFTTEYGSIESSCATGEELEGGGTIAGACDVVWTSQNPRYPVFNQDLIKTTAFSNSYRCPSHNGEGGPCPNDLGAIRGLRTTISVTAVGEEYFDDSDGTGLYSEGEEFENLPEAFTDYNEDWVYTPVLGPNCPNPPSSTANCEAAGASEPFVDFDGNKEYSLNDNPAVYNGSLCPLEGEAAGWCSRELVNVRDDIVLVMSDESEFGILMVNTRTERVVSKVEQGDRFTAIIADYYNNAPASGVTVSVEVKGGCSLLSPASFTPPDTNSPGAFSIPILVEGDGTDGSVTVKAGDSSKTFFCETFAPEDPLVPGP